MKEAMPRTENSSLEFPIVLLCFWLSGFTALLYQTAWTRELSFIFGTSELAVIAVLAAYMGGLALGSAIAGRFVQFIARPVLSYGVLEFAIAASALSMPLALRGIYALQERWIGGQLEWTTSPTLQETLFPLFAAFAVLLVPTALMGATLPLLARYAVRGESEIASRVGTLYAVNTAGAVIGTLITAFFLMPELGLRKTVWTGAALNIVIFAFAARLRHSRGGSERTRATPEETAPTWSWILPAIMLSGAVSFTLEVVWTRLLGHILGGSVQAFSTMLASFLLGIALGSGVAARVATTRTRAVAGFTFAQLGVAFCSYASLAQADKLPEWAARLGAGPEAVGASALISGALLLPTTLCIGATFPFALRVLSPNASASARATASVYAWNTVGAIVGALVGGYLLLPTLGFEGAVGVAVAVALMLAIVGASQLSNRTAQFALTGVCALGLLCTWAWPPDAPIRLLSSTPLQVAPTGGRVVFSGVGRSSSVMLFDQETHFRLSSNGLPESAIRKPHVVPATKTAYWLGILPSLLRPTTRDITVVGLGGGVAIELVPKTVERIDVIELEPEVVAANRAIGELRAIDPLSDPRVRIHLGDARGSLRLIERRVDAVVSQPSHPWTAGASHLYTKEFFELVHSRLRPEGVFVQWIGLAFIDETLLRSILATLLDVFPNVHLYRAEPAGLLFAASDAPFDPLVSGPRLLAEAPSELAAIGIETINDIATAWALDTAGVHMIANGAGLNTDDDNQLASRGSRLGNTRITVDGLTRLLMEQDPLIGRNVDVSALARRLVLAGYEARAVQLANSQTENGRQYALASIDLTAGRSRRAEAQFAKLLARRPDDREAMSGLAVARQADWVRDPERPLGRLRNDPQLVALIEAWRNASFENWGAVAEYDNALARFEPGEIGFEAATRLRIRQRLHTATADRIAEARALADQRLRKRWDPYDAVLKARGASAAGDSLAAWRTLQTLLVHAEDAEGREGVLSALREVVRQLPPELRQRVH